MASRPTDRGTIPSATAFERFAWAMYDFANSGYSTVVLTAVFNAYFVSVVAAGADMSTGAATALWTFAIAAGNAIVLVSAPVVGAIADFRALKKPFLAVVTIVCIVSIALLSLVGEGDVLLASVLVTLSFVMFASGENLISAFLPEITTTERMGRVSGYAWGVGYTGGLVTLALCLAYITWAQEQGLPATDYVPMSLRITAVVYVLAAAVTFAFLRERATPTSLERGQTYAATAYAKLRLTLSEARRFKDLFRFLVSLVIFQAGVSTVFVVAAIYAQEELGFSTSELVTMIMVVNVTAALGAVGIGQVQDKFGSRVALSLSLGTWIVALGVILSGENRILVWLGANLIGIAMGACQASGRALIGHFTPLERTGEFFGLWGLAVNLAAIIGPVTYGLISYLSGGDQRLALFSTLGFFVAGLILLLRVDETRGIAAARQAATG